MCSSHPCSSHWVYTVFRLRFILELRLHIPQNRYKTVLCCQSYNSFYCLILIWLLTSVKTAEMKYLFLIMKKRLYNIDSLKPHFYIVKQGFTGVYIIFLFLLKNIDCGYSLEPPRRGGSNEYPQSMFWVEIRKISEFLSDFFLFFGGKIFQYIWIGLFS